MADMAAEEVLLANDMADTGIVDDGIVPADEEMPTGIDAMDVSTRFVAWAMLSALRVSPVDIRFAIVAIVIGPLAPDLAKWILEDIEPVQVRWLERGPGRPKARAKRRRHQEDEGDTDFEAPISFNGA
ncbi:hypothetical protein B0A49_10342, partial [Cryomyces minteri]